MYILFLIPIALIILPIVSIALVVGHSSRIKLLENSVAELKERMKSGVKVAESVQQTATSTVQVSTPVPVKSNVASTVSPMASAPLEKISSEDTSGKILGRIGIGAVLIGVAFFLKYAFDNNWIGPAGRVMIGIIFGMGFLGLGQYIRSKYLQYSDLLMGGGIAVLYLSVFSAHSFYNLIDSGTTGVLMFIVTLLAFAISIANATQTLALVSVIGAFATPTLVGSHDNAMMMLFVYLTIINLGVLGVSFFKKWPRLNLASFIGTAINFMVWFGAFYNSDVLATTLFFCIITFLIFIIAQIARGITAGIKADEADYLLMGANALAFATIVYTILNPEYHGVLGFFSVLVAIVYILVAFAVNKANPEDTALNIFLPGLAVVFLSVAVPLQFSGPWIAVAWFVESVVLYGIASVISNRGFQVMGIVVYVLGLLDYLSWYSNLSRDPAYAPVFNVPFVILALAVIVAYIIAYMYKRFGSISAEIRERGIVAFFIIANVLSLWAITMQVTTFYSVQSDNLIKEHSVVMKNFTQYSNGYDTRTQSEQENQAFNDKMTSNGNVSNTLVSILWTLYAAVLTAVGFARRMASLRRFGLVLFLVTAVKVLIDVWNLGELYRIISFIGFGLIALAASFGYVKYKDRLKEILSLAILIGAGGLTALGFGGNVNVAQAAFVPTDWQYVRPISTSNQNGFVKAVLPTDISWTSTKGQFADVRVIDGQGREAPYLLSQSQISSSPIMSARLIGLTSTLNGSTEFIADMGGSNTVYSALELNIRPDSLNFRSQVHVYSAGSLLPIESSAWSLVTADGFIFRVTDPSTGTVSGKYSVSIPATASRYLKVVISEGVEGPVNVLGMNVSRDTQTFIGKSSSTFDATVFNDPKKKTTDVTIDLGAIGRSSDGVTLNINPVSTNYIRRVVVEVSDDMNSWRDVGGSSISRVSTSIFNGSSNFVTYSEVNARYIRLSIINDDNQPLSVVNSVDVSAPLHAIVFQADSNNSYSLYYGNPSANHPEYDTTQLSSYIDQNNLPNVMVGPQSENTSYIAPAGPVVPFTEKNKYLLNTVLVLLVIIIGAGVGWYLRSYIKMHK